jgi:hypothetical protein
MLNINMKTKTTRSRSKAKKEYRSISMPGYFTVETLEYGLLLHDAKSLKRHDELRWYYNDLYQVFLYTLSTLNHEMKPIDAKEAQRLSNMLAEIISVKNMLETPE